MPTKKHPAAYPPEYLSACYAALDHGEVTITLPNDDSRGRGRALNLRRSLYTWAQVLREQPLEAPPGAAAIAAQCEFIAQGARVLIRRRDQNPTAVAIRSALADLPTTDSGQAAVPADTDESASRLAALLQSGDTNGN
jgi:hypothetical protein